MIDRLISRVSHSKHSRIDYDYDASQAVVSSQIFNEDAERLTVVFPPWHGIERLTPLLNRRAKKFGTALLVYNLHDRILTSDIGLVGASFEYVKNRAASEINDISDKYSSDQIHLVGFSLGNVAMALTAREIERPFRATFVVGSSNLALSVLSGLRTRHLAKDIAVSPEELVSAWDDLAPATHAGSFKGHKVKTVISTHDKYIPTVYQEELATELTIAGADMSFDYSKLGHAMTMLRFSMWGEL